MSVKSPNTCLIVDDSRSIRVMIDHWMTRAGLFCIHTPNGREAKSVIEKSCPSVLITDIEMPLLNGLELIWWVRHNPDNQIAAIPIVVISSLDDPDLEAVVAEIGARFVLRKPLSEVAIKQSVFLAMNNGHPTANREKLPNAASVAKGSHIRQLAADAMRSRSQEGE